MPTQMCFCKHENGWRLTPCVILQDIEAVDPEYYKNLKWMLENNITDVLDLTFTEESDYFGKKELVELKPGGKDIRSVSYNNDRSQQITPLHAGYISFIPSA